MQNNRSKTELSTVDERLNAVARLHKPVVEWVVMIACDDGECEHEDGNHPEVPMTVCQECRRLQEDIDDETPYLAWPCETAKAGGFDNLTAETALKGK